MAPIMRRPLPSSDQMFLRCAPNTTDGRGQRTLLVSAYMPSGLDHLAASSPLHDVADDLYATILKWAQGMQQVIVMGDLNETRVAADRASAAAARAPAAAIPSPKHIDHLEREGFIDVYRHLHPLDAPPASPGFTHFVPNPPSSSRIDYHMHTRRV